MELNEKQEKFCQAYVLRHNAAEAARIAGYAEKYAHTQGYKFLKGDTPLSEKINTPEIKERIEELEGQLETNVDVIAEIETQYNNANRSNNATSAIKALELLSKVRGVKSDQDVDKSTEDRKVSIVKNLKILGKEKAMELIKLCEFK